MSKSTGKLLAKLFPLLILLFSIAANAETYVLRVDGLACPFCSYGIEKQLGRLPGVTNLATNIKAGTVTVRTRKGSKLSRAQLASAVKRAGFSLRSVK